MIRNKQMCFTLSVGNQHVRRVIWEERNIFLNNFPKMVIFMGFFASILNHCQKNVSIRPREVKKCTTYCVIFVFCEVFVSPPSQLGTI